MCSMSCWALTLALHNSTCIENVCRQGNFVILHQNKSGLVERGCTVSTDLVTYFYITNSIV